MNAEFQELQEDPAEKALWVKSLREARAMSVHTAVRTAQPNLDGDEADEEVQRILAEDHGRPATVGRGPKPPVGGSFN